MPFGFCSTGQWGDASQVASMIRRGLSHETIRDDQSHQSSDVSLLNLVVVWSTRSIVNQSDAWAPPRDSDPHQSDSLDTESLSHWSSHSFNEFQAVCSICGPIHSFHAWFSGSLVLTDTNSNLEPKACLVGSTTEDVSDKGLPGRLEVRVQVLLTKPA